MERGDEKRNGKLSVLCLCFEANEDYHLLVRAVCSALDRPTKHDISEGSNFHCHNREKPKSYIL
jgi:hypothetical protein